MQENTANGIYNETQIEEGFYVLKYHNDSQDNLLYRREVSSRFIQFHFCLKGSGFLQFNNLSLIHI